MSQDDKPSPFIYLLNAMDRAMQEANPAQHGYAEKRRAVLEYVAKLEAAAPSAERATDWPTFNDGVEAAAAYCAKTLADNHPHLAHAFRHAAFNIRAFAAVRLATDAAPQVPEVREAPGNPIDSSPAVAAPTSSERATVTGEMVDRFLAWRLPEDFHPDAGISFSPYFNVEYNAKQGKPPQRHQPIGTNLFTADQARQMLEHVLQGAAPSASGPADAWLIERSNGSKEVVLSPLTDDTFMDEGDEAWPLYRARSDSAGA